ncbi:MULTISPECIES: hypothetical protein [unclassified Frankia]|uniref:hypothetical protein n=1 Tax=unclassified Frankia TaxID=2632575 RepID=UPI002AD308DB|nr:MULTISPECIES: hypothetical protein [unclassified Frankia]
MRYRLMGPDEELLEDGEATAVVRDHTLVVSPKAGQPLQVRCADILGVTDVAAGALLLQLAEGPMLLLEGLGRLHGQVLADLVQARAEDLIQTLLLMGVGRPERFAGALDGVDAALYLYDDALIAVPDLGDPEQVPYSFLGEIAAEGSGYHLEIATLDGRRLVIARLGRRTGEFRELLRVRVSAARARSGHLVSALLPGLGSLAARRVAGYLADGVATPRAQLDGVDPTMFTSLVAVCSTPRQARCIDVLATIGTLWFGLHQSVSVEREGWSTGRDDAHPIGPRNHAVPTPAPGGLAGVAHGGLVDAMGSAMSGGLDAEPDVDAVLAYRLLGGYGREGAGFGGQSLGHDHQPRPRAQPNQGRAHAPWTDLAALTVSGDAPTVLAFTFCETARHVLFEVLSEDGHATYVYRAYPGCVPALNQALALLGFRVAAIYSDAATAASPYRQAVERLPYLRVLREAFVGRIIHTDDWEQQVRTFIR